LGGAGSLDYQPLTAGGSQRDFSPNPPAYSSGGYHDRQGLVSRQSSSAGKSKMYMPNSTWTWAFSIIAISQAVIALAIEGYVFGKFEYSLRSNGSKTPSSNSASRTIPTYLALFIFGFIYELVLVWDALRAKNTIQVIGLCLYNLGMLIYSAVEMNQVDDAINEDYDGLRPEGLIDPGIWHDLRPFLLAAPCLIALGTILMSFVAWKLYHEFAWTIYKNISADLRLKRRYLTFQVSPKLVCSKGSRKC
jgi:hypothetical protein